MINNLRTPKLGTAQWYINYLSRSFIRPQTTGSLVGFSLDCHGNVQQGPCWLCLALALYFSFNKIFFTSLREKLNKTFFFFLIIWLYLYIGSVESYPLDCQGSLDPLLTITISYFKIVFDSVGKNQICLIRGLQKASLMVKCTAFQGEYLERSNSCFWYICQKNKIDHIYRLHRRIHDKYTSFLVIVLTFYMPYI